MDPLTYVVEKAKTLAKSSGDFVSSLLRHGEASTHRNPIEILKRLQREAFSDLMKLRDRQDKVERILTFYKSSKGSPFQEASTYIRGEVDVLGAVFFMGDVDQQHVDALDKSEIRPGMCSRFTFETSVTEKDKLVAEFVADQRDKGHNSYMSASPLSLAKVCYLANISDWFSAIAIPVGARFRDFDAATKFFDQGLGNFSTHGPPLLSQHKGSAIGLTMRKSNIVASLAQSVSGLQPSCGFTHCFSTFGQLMCQLPRRVKLSLLGLHQVPKSSSNFLTFGAIAIPVGFLRLHQSPDLTAEPRAPRLEMDSEGFASSGSVALKLDSELDEYTRLGAWIEMKNSNSKHLKWAVSVSDNCEDESGWGLSAGGMVESPTKLEQFQIESYLKLNLGKRFCLKPGLAYVVNENGRTVALMLRCNWFL